MVNIPLNGTLEELGHKTVVFNPQTAITKTFFTVVVFIKMREKPQQHTATNAGAINSTTAATPTVSGNATEPNSLVW